MGYLAGSAVLAQQSGDVSCISCASSLSQLTPVPSCAAPSRAVCGLDIMAPGGLAAVLGALGPQADTGQAVAFAGCAGDARLGITSGPLGHQLRASAAVFSPAHSFRAPGSRAHGGCAMACLGFFPQPCVEAQFLTGLSWPAAGAVEAVAEHPIFRGGGAVAPRALSGLRRDSRRGTVLCWLLDQQRYRVRMSADKARLMAHHRLAVAPKAKAAAAMAPFRGLARAVVQRHALRGLGGLRCLGGCCALVGIGGPWWQRR